MSDRIVLHIGAMKTGTTFLQTTLERNYAVLADAGIEYTTGRFGHQTRAVTDVLKRKQGDERLKRWRRLAKAARRAEAGTSVISMEFLSFANDQQVREFITPLRRRRVEVVITVRDQFLVAPAQWQTHCRNHGQSDWPTYLREIEEAESGTRKKRSPAYRTFHRAQDVDRILRRWASVPQVSQTHVVTVPAGDAPRHELWDRFFQAVGVDPPPVDFGVAAPNTSLGYGSCDLLRRLNRHLTHVPGRPYRDGMRQLAREVLAPRRDLESRPRLDRRAAHDARARNERLRGLIAETAVLHGTLDDLPVPDALDHYDPTPVPVPRKETVSAARAAWDYLTDRAGDGGRSPHTLDGLVKRDAELLQLVHGW